jgi:hypothetical protein
MSIKLLALLPGLDRLTPESLLISELIKSSYMQIARSGGSFRK